MAKKNTSKNRKELAAQLHAAVNALDVTKVQALLASGVDADAWGITEDYDRPLQSVARHKGGDAVAIARALIDAGADIDFQGDYDCTALTRSVEREGKDAWVMARYLIGAGANPSLPNRDGNCAAEYASSIGHDSAIVAMLEAGMPSNVRGICGPLIWYCAWDSPDLVRHLLARGADPNDAVSHRSLPSQTPLQRAAESFDEECIDESTFLDIAIPLIQAGADPAQIDPVPECLEAFLLSRKEHEMLSDLLDGKTDGRPNERL